MRRRGHAPNELTTLVASHRLSASSSVSPTTLAGQMVAVERKLPTVFAIWLDASSNKCLTSSNKKLLGAPGIATRSKDAIWLEAAINPKVRCDKTAINPLPTCEQLADAH